MSLRMAEPAVLIDEAKQLFVDQSPVPNEEAQRATLGVDRAGDVNTLFTREATLM
jgi:hypothetical protein